MKKGTVFIIIGIVLIAGALGLTGYNIIIQDRAEKASSQIVSALADVIPETRDVENGVYLDSVGSPDNPYSVTEFEVPDYILDPERDMPTISVDGTKYVAEIKIPKLDLDLPVHADWDYTKLKTAPCVFSGSIYTDDLVICAHNYRKHFSRLRTLRAGDKVTLTDMDGNLFEYEVIEIEVLQPSAIEAMTKSEYDLSLFTCTTGGQTRLTVRCNKLDK